MQNSELTKKINKNLKKFLAHPLMILLLNLKNVFESITFLANLNYSKMNISQLISYLDWNKILYFIVTLILYYVSKQFQKLKEEVSNSVTELKKSVELYNIEYQNFKKNIYGENYLKYDVITTRLFRDVFFYDLLNQNNTKEYYEKISELLFLSGINLKQLKEYGLKNTTFINFYNHYINKIENQILEENDSALREMLNQNKLENEPNRDKQ